MFAPVIVPSFSRTSATSSLRGRSSVQTVPRFPKTFTPSACSSSSARPVLRATVCISGIVSSNSSARCPILLLSRYARQRTDIDGERAFIERRKEAAPDKEYLGRSGKGRWCCRVSPVCEPAPCQRLFVNAFIQRATKDSFSSLFVLLLPSR